mmetsp:Transcript_23970/g.49815  ORF Transcript_23970/g.49815 Transcript_23970/m.49815 type:complete len:100 (-) Transcript_23970:50-349(-)
MRNHHNQASSFFGWNVCGSLWIDGCCNDTRHLYHRLWYLCLWDDGLPSTNQSVNLIGGIVQWNVKRGCLPCVMIKPTRNLDGKPSHPTAIKKKKREMRD